MAEIIQRDGTWTFDGETLRLVPGRDKNVTLLRKSLGELAVPLGALAGIAFEQGKKSGRLRLRLRDGADPLLQADRGQARGRRGPLSAGRGAGPVRGRGVLRGRGPQRPLLDQVPSAPCDSYLLPGPAVPLSVSAGDGTASFDGEHIRLEWNWKTEEAKSAAGTRSLALADIAAVEWQPAAGLENGYLRFTVRQLPHQGSAEVRPELGRAVGLQEGLR